MPLMCSSLPGQAFQGVFDRGKRLAQSSLVLITVSSSAGPGCRLGIMVSRRVARNAVPRNRLRRILRESFKIQSMQMLRRPVDCILIARPTATSLKSRQDADVLIRKLLMKI